MRSSKYVYGLAVIISAAVFGGLQWSSSFADPDSFYHARLAQLMAEHGLLYTFPWLSVTSLAESFTDQHLLYHLLVAPLTWFVDPLIATKIAQVVLLVLLTLTFIAILRSWKLPYGGLAVVLLFVIGPFLFRINLVKATALALLLLFMVTALLLHRRYGWALFVTILYTWAHGGFILAIVVGVACWVGDTIAQSLRQERIQLGDPRAIWTSLGGVVIGLVCNPYFPHNLSFLWQQLIHIGIVNYAGKIEVGAEWYPFSASALLSVASVLVISCIAAGFVMVTNRRQLTRQMPAWTLAILGVLFLLATLRSRRYIEYFIPFTWLWASYILLPYIASGQAKRQLVQWKQRLGSWFTIFRAYIVLAVIATWGVSLSGVWTDLRTGFSFDQYAAASQFIRQTAAPGAVVFNGDWDDFPLLFYHNAQNYYIVGLDATFMYLYNQDKYTTWRKLGRGDIKENVAATIRDQFQAEYVFIDRGDESTKLLDAYLLRDPQAELQFEDESTRVYHLMPS